MWEHAYAAFGLRLASPVPLALRPDDGAARPALALRPASGAELERRWSGTVRLLWEGRRDGVTVRVERGAGGEHRMRAAGVASFVLSADGSELACAADGERGRGWERMLVELALPCASLLLGHEALHAAGVALDGGVVALLAPSGGGKSTLAAALLDAGGALLSDDVCVLRRTPAAVLAEPGAPELKRAPRTGGPEARVALPCDPLAAQPLALLVVLARGAGNGATPRLDPLDASPLAVLAHALSLPSTPARAGARLALYRDLLADTPALRLVADAHEPPARLAELIADAASSSEAALVA
jgi:hypothetical protein